MASGQGAIRQVENRGSAHDSSFDKESHPILMGQFFQLAISQGSGSFITGYNMFTRGESGLTMGNRGFTAL